MLKSRNLFSDVDLHQIPFHVNQLCKSPVVGSQRRPGLFIFDHSELYTLRDQRAGRASPALYGIH